MEDYYDILGVSEDASTKEIKHAYRRLCFKYHPDTNPDSSDNHTEKLNKINEAYDILSNSEKRQQYDSTRTGYYNVNYDTGADYSYARYDNISGKLSYQELLRIYGYSRPYCENCGTVYSIWNFGVNSLCSKCGHPLSVKSFNPWPKALAGIGLLGGGIAMVIYGLPIIWIGAFIWGGQLIHSAHKQWSQIKKMEENMLR